MITSIDKDKILDILSKRPNAETNFPFSIEDLRKNTSLGNDTIFAILRQFERFKLVSDFSKLNNDEALLTVNVDAHDFYQKGGFVVQDDIFKANIEKLQFEIENLRSQLEPNHLEYLNKISAIGSAIMSGLALFPTK